MRQQSPSRQCLRFKLTRTKHQVVSHRVGTCVHVPRRLLGHRTEMDTHPRKVPTEALLHLQTQRRLKGTASAGQDILDAGGSGRSFTSELSRDALDTRRLAGHGLRRRCQHLAGNPVRFLFVDVPWFIDLQLGSDHTKFQKSRYGPIPDRSLQKRDLVNGRPCRPRRLGLVSPRSRTVLGLARRASFSSAGAHLLVDYPTVAENVIQSGFALGTHREKALRTPRSVPEASSFSPKL